MNTRKSRVLSKHFRVKFNEVISAGYVGGQANGRHNLDARLRLGLAQRLGHAAAENGGLFMLANAFQQRTQFFQPLFPAACPLRDQHANPHVSLYCSGNFVDHGQVVTAEHGENDRLPSGAQKLKDGIATCRGCDYKPVYSLTYLLT